MTTRDIFILALRVLGFWMLLRAVGLLAYALAMTCQLLGVSSGNSWPEYGLIDVLVTAWLPISIQCIAACVLFRYATNIASLFYGQAECAEETPPVISITESGMYRVTSRLLEVYALLAAIPPLSRSVHRSVCHRRPCILGRGRTRPSMFVSDERGAADLWGTPDRPVARKDTIRSGADPGKYHSPEQREG